MITIHRSPLFAVLDKIIDTMCQTTVSPKQINNKISVIPTSFTDHEGRVFDAFCLGSAEKLRCALIYDIGDVMADGEEKRYRVMWEHYANMVKKEFPLEFGTLNSYSFPSYQSDERFSEEDCREVGIMLSTILYHGVAAQLSDVRKAEENK